MSRGAQCGAAVVIGIHATVWLVGAQMSGSIIHAVMGMAYAFAAGIIVAMAVEP